MQRSICHPARIVLLTLIPAFMLAACDRPSDRETAKLPPATSRTPKTDDGTLTYPQPVPPPVASSVASPVTTEEADEPLDARSSLGNVKEKADRMSFGKDDDLDRNKNGIASNGASGETTGLRGDGNFNTENYSRIYENEFHEAAKDPLSTFSIDVDGASYSNVRRFISDGSLPPKDAVRIEEFVNYFTYDYPQPKGNVPFSINTDVAVCPWDKSHRLVEIGLQGKQMEKQEMPPSNLVFLIDVSGSMDEPNKLPLLQSAFRMLVGQLRDRDKVSIVVYAGAAGMVLPPTSGSNKAAILDAIDRLQSGGSTDGGAGIQLAYSTARQNFVASGNNRVILATDGDFNVGTSSDGDLVRLIEQERESGVFLTVLGFGTGNLKDSKMEQLADKGNGNYSYVDNLNEAKKVFVSELGATLFTIAKDVKIQVEFNPAQVKGYRLIGYENRMLQSQDFNDDKKDAGELGAGHSVTALYEVVPVGDSRQFASIDPLKYQSLQINAAAGQSNELMTVKLRYKLPADSISKLITGTVVMRGQGIETASDNLKFAAAVAEWGLVLRDSKFKGTATFDDIIHLATAAKGADPFGYRAEFIGLVEKSKGMK